MEQRAAGLLPETIHLLTAAQIKERWEARKLRGLFYVGDDDYHGGPGLSSTGIKRILRSPAHFMTEKPDSKARRVGRIIHEALLQPELFAKTYIWEPKPGGPRNRNPWKQDWEAFQKTAEERGLEIVDWDTGETLQGIVAALGTSATFQNLVRGARFEVAAFAQRNIKDEAILTKAKADILVSTGDHILIPDLKTCQDASPDAFQRSIVDYGYHISAAYYIDTFAAALGMAAETFSFVWIAVEKQPPHGVRFYVSSPEMLRIGRAEYEKALAVYAECQATGTWPAYPETFSQIDLPQWYARRFT